MSAPSRATSTTCLRRLTSDSRKQLPGVDRLREDHYSRRIQSSLPATDPLVLCSPPVPKGCWHAPPSASKSGLGCVQR